MNAPARRLVLHIGTPKTGTTSLQIALGDQTEALGRRGVLVPRAGRGATPLVGAHHALATVLANTTSAVDGRDDLPALLAELDRSTLPLAILSSENFAWLYHVPENLAEMIAELRTIGYATTVIFYARDQSAFAEAVYAEFVQQGFAWTVDSYVGALLDRTPEGAKNAWTFCFDYFAIAERFAEVVGRENVIVRPYRVGVPPAYLLDDFSHAIGAPGDGASLFGAHASLHNPRLTPLGLLDRLYANARSKPTDAPNARALIRELGLDETAFGGRSFAMLTSVEIDRIGTTFAASNRELARRYGCEIELVRRTSMQPRPPDRVVLDRATVEWSLQAV